MKIVVVTNVALTFVKQDLPAVPPRQQPQLVPTNAKLEIKEDEK